MFAYSVNLQWSKDDGGYIAVVPELPGVSAFGESAEDAVSEVQDAAVAYINSLKADGQPVPPPLEMSEYSGQLRVRMPKTLHARLAHLADLEAVSLNTFIVHLLSCGSEASELSLQLRDVIAHTPDTLTEATRGHLQLFSSQLAEVAELQTAPEGPRLVALTGGKHA